MLLRVGAFSLLQTSAYSAQRNGQKTFWVYFANVKQQVTIAPGTSKMRPIDNQSDFEAAQTTATRKTMVQDSIVPLPVHDCTALFKTLQAVLSWQWDGRFQTALAQIGMAEKDAMRVTLENHLGPAWDSATIDTAPESVRRAIGRLGGIMPGHLFYAVELSPDGMVFCAWWPWGNGRTISIRVGASPEGSALLATLVPADAR